MSEITTEVPTLKVPVIDVTMENGDSFHVQTDNRDLLRWDETSSRKGWADPSKAPFLWMTFIGWSALKRTGQYAGSWDQFRAEAVEVASAEDVNVGPTQTDPMPD